MTMIDKDTVELVELAINIGAIDYAPFENTLVITYDDLQAFSTALLKEVHAGNEAVMFAIPHYKEALEINGGKTLCADTKSEFYSVPLYTFPPTKEVGALRAKLKIAESLVDFELLTELEDRYKAVED